jgi:murein DD-endopeptidase MepM/ murein hydrolase activator NlpD
MSSNRSCLRIFFSAFIVVAIAGGFFIYRNILRDTRAAGLSTIFRNVVNKPKITIQAGEKCGDAPFLMPTNGSVRYFWDESFRPGHRHQGIDIFGRQGLNVTPIIAAYPGYLTRLPEWKSTVIIRHPKDPLDPGRQIWTYYTHMADPQANSFIVPEYPPGTTEVYVEAGALLGFQGNYSGNPGNPTGVHLHFSIVKDDGRGRFRNELEFQNTLDPSPYLGIQVNANKELGELPECMSSLEG